MNNPNENRSKKEYKKFRRSIKQNFSFHKIYIFFLNKNRIIWKAECNISLL